jgi:GTP cyclohydrolase I
MDENELSEVLNRTVFSTARLSAQLATRIALAMQEGASPNQIQAWVGNTFIPVTVRGITQDVAKIVLDTVVAEMNKDHETTV